MTTHIVSFSGGRTSAYLVHLMEEKRKIEGLNVKYVFMDTGAEHPLTYKFVKDVVNYYGIDLICIRAAIPPTLGEGITYDLISVDEIGFDLSIWQKNINKYGIPNVSIPKCTDRLKTVPFYKWLKDNVTGDYIDWLGIRIDEPRRLKTKDNVRYLAEISDFEKQDIIDFWGDMPFDLELKHECLGNCVFCIKKSPNKIALAERYEPEIFEQFHRMIESPDVRKMNSSFPDNAMYRGYLSSMDIIAMFKDHSDEELEKTIRSKKQTNTGSCSESCEALLSPNLETLFGDL